MTFAGIVYAVTAQSFRAHIRNGDHVTTTTMPLSLVDPAERHLVVSGARFVLGERGLRFNS